MEGQIKVLSLQFDSELENLFKPAEKEFAGDKDKLQLLADKHKEKKGLKEDLITRSNEFLNILGDQAKARVQGERHTLLDSEVMTLTRSLAFLKDSFQKNIEDIRNGVLKAERVSAESASAE